MSLAHPLASRTRLMVWASFGLLAVLLLGLFAFLDMGEFGRSSSERDPHPYATADRVQYGLGVWRSFYRGDILTVSPTHPLLWGWALCNAALLWPLRRRFAAARVMFWIHALTAAGMIAAGLTLLPYAAQEHNALLSGDPDAPARWVSAFFPLLEARRCTDPGVVSGCNAWAASTFLNPVWPGLMGVTFAPVLGLLAAILRPRP